MLWLLLLPFRLLFGVVAGLIALPFVILLLPLALVVWLPFALLRLAFRLVFLVVMLPVMIIAAVVGVLAVGAALVGAVLVPLLPLLILGGLGWLVWRTHRPCPPVRGLILAIWPAGSGDAFRLPPHAQIHDPLQQRLVADADLVGRRGEVLALGDLRVRIGFQHPDISVRIEP